MRMKGIKTRFFSLIMVIAMVVAQAWPTTAFAADDDTSVTININNPVSGGTGYTYSSSTVRITAGGNYLIESDGTATTNRIVVANGVTANITLSNVRISISTINGCAFDMTGATVNLILTGDNSLSSGLFQAGLKAPTGAVLTINGSGSLTAKSAEAGSSAGIGGGNSQNGGEINILGGEVTAIGGNSGAGIGGGGSGTNSGGINISGGTITARGGAYGAGIGGGAGGSGGIINISGGIITAVGGSAGAGIGGGLNGGSGTINISGNAQISATGGGPIQARQNGWDIGSGSDNSSNGTLRIQGDGSKNPTVIFTTYGTDAPSPLGVEKPYTNCMIEGAGAKDRNSIDITGVYGPEGKEQAPLIISSVPSSMEMNETFNLRSLISGGSTTGDISYSVTGNGVTVNHEGFVTAVQAGTATIMVTKDGDKYFSPVSAIIDNITVTERVTLESIEVKQSPDKHTYYIKETLNLNGLVIVGNYSDNTTATLSINEAHVSGFDSSMAEENQVITVTYEGKITTFTVDIVIPPIPTINPTSVNFDVTAPTHLATSITWGMAASVTDVVYGNKNLVLGTDYTINGDKLTIYANYLETLGLKQGDKVEINILFDDNNILTLTVNAIEGYIASHNNDLKQLTLSAGTLNPNFSKDIVTYNASVNSGITSTNVTPVTADNNATVIINGTPVTSGSAISISLNTGNNPIIIVVTAEKGNTKTYTININRASSSGGGGGSGTSGGGSSTQTLTIDKIDPTKGTAGTDYSYRFIASGGNGGYSFAVTSGTLPEGLSLSKDGVISGTPTKAGTYQYTITATDQNGRVVRHSFTQVIGEEGIQKVNPSKKQIRLTIGKLETKIEDETHLMDAVPFIDGESNRTLVPIKFISEALGAEVVWLPETRQVLIKQEEKEILLTIGSKEVLVNGEIIIIDCEPRIMPPGRTFVPLRFVSELLGAMVEYDVETREISIIK